MDSFRKTLSLSIEGGVSDRVIRGIATSPIYDRVGELITTEAVRKAMDNFMVLPVITCGHQDFPVGKVTDYTFDEQGQLIIECVIKKTSDCDDVWSLIEKGELNAFSISGRRTKTTCTNISKKCVTEGIHLYSIALCGDDKCNPAATFNIVKSLLGEDIMTEAPKEEEVLVEVAKTVDTGVTLDALSNLLDQKLSAVLSKTVESEKEEEEDEVKKSFEQYDKKLEELTNLLKSLNTTVEAMEKRVEIVESTPITKGGIVIDEAGSPKAVGDVDPYLMARINARLRSN